MLILMTDGWCISCEIALRWISLDLTDGKSTLVQVMAWCRQPKSHFRCQCWPRSMLPYDITRLQWAMPVLYQAITLANGDILSIGPSVTNVNKIWIKTNKFLSRNCNREFCLQTVVHFVQVLTHWGRDKIDAISQTSFSNAFSWMIMYESRLKFHWSLFLKV